MKPFCIIPMVTTMMLIRFMANASPGAAPVTNAPACVELRDQFNALQKLYFPTTNITLLTIADWKGSGEVSGWVMPVKRRFGTRVDIRGIADVCCVPRLLHGLVQRRFRKEQTYPVMMDWTGDTVKAFSCVPAKANVLVLNRQGKILYRTSGKANDQAIQDLCNILEQALSATTDQTKTK